MKYLICILLLFSVLTYGQRKIDKYGRLFWLPGKTSESLSTYLYSSGVNVIEVFVKDLPFDRIELKADSLVIRKSSVAGKCFFVKVLGNPKSLFVRVYAGDELIDSIPFLVRKDIEHVYVHLTGERSTTTCGGRYMPFWLDDSRLYIDDPYEHNMGDSSLFTKYKIISFAAQIEVDHKVVYKEKFEGDRLNPAIGVAWRKNAKKGKFRITLIKVQDMGNGNIYSKPDEYYNGCEF